MRKIIVIEFLTLDGVMQAPGGSKEDIAEGFRYGGWTAPYFDKFAGNAMASQMKSADLLLGRITYTIFAGYWPEHEDGWPGINDVNKYVLSKTMKTSHWQHSVFLKSVADIEKLKKSKGSDLQVWGSSKLVHLLLKHDLVDELWLKIFPVTLGTGKKLFDNGAMPAAYTLMSSSVSPKGVIFANYKRAGKVITGEVGA